ncbi:MAG: EcsC family protein [Methylovirgula sp.]
MSADLPLTLSAADQAALAKAIVRLERSNLMIRLADYAGQPISRVMRALPKGAQDKVQAAVHRALLEGMRVTVKSLDRPAPAEPANLAPKVIAGVAGGISGFAGLAALPIELPITTVNMLRAIAAIARAEGESLADRETQMACLEVFALGHRGGGIAMEAGYYALRTMLAKTTGEAVTHLLQRGAAEEMAPALVRLVSEIAARYGLIVSDRAAASAIPVLGALGGATINWVFMDYFQEVARGHFTMRRLERAYGAEPIQELYHEVVRRLVAKQAATKSKKR